MTSPNNEDYEEQDLPTGFVDKNGKTFNYRMLVVLLPKYYGSYFSSDNTIEIIQYNDRYTKDVGMAVQADGSGMCCILYNLFDKKFYYVKTINKISY